MSVYNIFFYFFEILAAIAVIAMLFSRNVFYAALLLLVCLLSIAGLYILAYAEFVAVTQILIYAGGILVVILFGIMLTAKTGGKPLLIQHTNLFSGILIGLSLVSLLTWCVWEQPQIATAQGLRNDNNIQIIGINLMTSHVLPFEMVGILLLVSLIGAAVIASHKAKKI